MRALILWADDRSPNLGVRALGAGTAALVRRIWPDAEITFQNFGHRIPELPIGTLRSLAREHVTGEKGMRRWLAGFDLVIDTRSGDSFSDSYGLRRMAIMSAVAESAGLAGTPLALGPQTIGPFTSQRGRWLGRRSLGRADAVIARDSASAEYASRHGRPVDARSSDVVFALPTKPRTGERDVVLNVSGLLWNPNPHVDSERYRETIRGLHSRLVGAGREVSLLAHVLDSPAPDNDVPVIRELAAELGAEALVPQSLDDARELVASADLVIASRMHACLNALSQGTPAIPLAYSRKFSPLLRDLDWYATVDLRTDPEPVETVMGMIARHDLAHDATEVSERARAGFADAERVLEGVV
ncbi:polysaccharide pyruvyl transferase family protein [Salinibacterium sp. SYSU T00001]|uniref:polysaccharide pyruvyl transferase family protein n=1 Tax=Homoserinimonas sedimenticola TaxID=2986805 RepID=UPI00223565CA|nr:polysaccharide pyruvyl transferase family protein [Salinibacterium sedimenticola]MCW4385450.1 polysaccharide pyruvyl transferase family protein [Salinibacterium sedimenticola]